MLLYYITDRTQFRGAEAERRSALLDRIAEAARCEVDYIQLREKDLPARDLESLAHAALERIRAVRSRTRLLINSRTDVALAVHSDGVHLRSDDISPKDVRKIWRESGNRTGPVIAVSSHTEHDVISAQNAGANFAVFGPVFEKKEMPCAQPAGLERLRAASTLGIPVLVLGGITLENAALCEDAGAAGVAGIRLFQKGVLMTTVKKLRAYL